VSIIFIGAALVVVIIVTGTTNAGPYIAGLLGLIATTIPALLALYKSEITQNTLTDGVLVSQVTEGATKAIVESTVQRMLEQNTQALKVNTLAQQANTAAQPDKPPVAPDVYPTGREMTG